MKCDSLLDYDISLKELKSSKIEDNVYMHHNPTVIIYRFSKYLEKINPKFDRKLFLKRIGIED